MSPGTILLAPRLAENGPLVGAGLAGGMYWHGMRRSRTVAWRAAVGRERVSGGRWRAAAFAAGLTTVAAALGGPLDRLAEKLFWVHMVQHVLLLVVAAPLIVIGAPWMGLWRAFSLRFRRRLARAVAHGRPFAPLRALAAGLGVPAVAWVLLNGDLLAWHLPAAYDLTLRSDGAHYLEHATFLAFGVLAWGQVIDSEPFRGRLSPPGRGVFAFGSMLVGWLLALGLAFAGKPWYTPYADLHGRPGGISALADQHLAAGVMWVPASLPWSLAIFILIYMWVSGRDVPVAQPRGVLPVSHTARRIHV